MNKIGGKFGGESKCFAFEWNELNWIDWHGCVKLSNFIL